MANMNIIWDCASLTIIFLFVIGLEITSGNQEPFAQDDGTVTRFEDYRLPKTIIPVNYEMNLMPKLEGDFKFDGLVRIQAIVQQSTDTITLHHGNIDIKFQSVTLNKQNINIVSKRYNTTTEKYEIKLEETLDSGANISINFDYTGQLRDDMIGFYRSSYVDSNGKIRWMASTQFQTKHARHAFPCFDEPGFKATFIVRILRSSNYNCLSNMPIQQTSTVAEGIWDVFKQSIPMSTYLVAFTISDFAKVKVDNFSVWARPNAVDQAKYALDVGPRALKQLSTLFKQEYQLPKMDMVAVPDFSAGAMENWGLITYRETRLLRDESSTSDAATQSIASVIVHELTHMWFGNMITPEWWSYLWLSEGFARYFQYFGTAEIEKSWNMEDQFVVEQHQTAYASDGVESSQPMTREVSNSQQLGSIGDTITYNKGASVLRMTNHVFGSDVFYAVIQNYLRNNKEKKVANPDDLWRELDREINVQGIRLNATIREIMSTWTTQAGFPVLNVSIDKNGEAKLQQTRFLLRNLKSTPTNLTWWIPLTWTTKANPNFNAVSPKYWMSKERDTVKLGYTSGWVIFNVQSSGFYRVNYDNASWYRIFDTLNSKSYGDIHVLNRAALVDDCLNLARAGWLSYNTGLDCLRYLQLEKNYLPFKSAFSGLSYLDQRLSGHDEYYKRFQKFVLILIENRYKELGYFDRPSDDRLTVLLRGELNKWACNYGHEGCIQTFTELFQRWRKNSATTIKANQRSVAYCMGVKYGTKSDWTFLWNRYFNSNSANEQITILQALGCTNDTTILETYLLSALKSFEETRIRKQDCTAVFSAVYTSGRAGAELVLNFVDKYYLQMKQYDNEMGLISSVLSSASQRFSTKELVNQFERLIQLRNVEFESILKSLQNSLDIAKYELLWVEKYQDSIISWINSFNEEKSVPPEEDTRDTTDYRLPADLSPNNYNIWIGTDIDEAQNFTFDGEVKINALVKQKTKTIVLHSADLVHNNITVHLGNNGVGISNTSVDQKYDFLKISLAQELQAGQTVTIKVSYRGYLNEDMRGFYRSWYIDDDNVKRWLAATHMEPVAARKMFPCFDEPAMKAKFTINVTILQNYNAISNMPLERAVQHQNGRKSLLFRETPKMSTYLVALVVSDFTERSDPIGTYAVWARSSMYTKTEYALNAMRPLVNYYEKSLSLPYTLPKMDMVALPDFVSGAMENWGLLTYKERYLLYDLMQTTTATEQSIANVISHEITHQWFGDLVSPLWWKYLWLNEGFARYFQYLGTANWKKDWSLDGQFVVEQLHSALESDSLASSHAMSHDVYSPTEIRSIFDTISYAKAASVIRMMEKSFGHNVFFAALHNYLKKREYDVAIPEDLFDAFKDQIEDPQIKNSIHNIMNTWTTQPGYPVVHVDMRPDERVMLLTQERFILKPGKDTVAPATWCIPITWTSLNASNFNDTKPKYWFTNTTTTTVELPNNRDLILLNVQQSGFYRTKYDVETWKRIIEILKSDQRETIHEINRATLVDDLMNLGRAGLVDYDVVLSAMQYLAAETDYLPWRAFFNGLNHLHKHMQERDAFAAFQRYVGSLIDPIYKKLGFRDNTTESHITKLFRSHVRKWACKLNVSDCQHEALQYWANRYEIPANSLSVVYCTVASRNDIFEWQTLWLEYQRSQFPAEKLIILQSLACATDKVILEGLLQEAISKDSGIRFEDSSSVFSSVMDASPRGVEAVIDFVKNNYEKMVSYFRKASDVHSIVNTIGKKVFTRNLYNQYDKLLAWLGERDRIVQNDLKSYKSDPDYELKWADRHVPRLHKWFEFKYPHEDYRLPATFSPVKYDIFLSPRFEEANFTFNGTVRIEVKRKRDDVSRIVVNSYKLNILSVSVYEQNPSQFGQKLEVSEPLLNETTQTLSIFTKDFIKSDQAIVEIQFTGYLNDDMTGFYRSHYVDEKGRLRWLAATQFESIYARKAFPCFDEPAMKANFSINIVRPKDYIALSNMPLLSSLPTNDTEYVLDKFKDTVPMSSYLVAFVVSDFTTVTKDKGFLNVWGRPEVVKNGVYAQDAAAQLLKYLEKETGHRYELPKMDLVGIPDFDMGAMENWGLVTFREYGIFYDRNVTTAKYTDYIITIIAHELSHMMFGNLVTCDWWEYIWLNEGFAEYMQWHLSNLFAPTYGYNDLFVVDELQPALFNDAWFPTHPMNNPVSKPSDIVKIFDTVTYGKSSSVIRMVQKTFDPLVFTRATHQYLAENKYNTTTPTILWKYFNEEVNKTGGLGEWEISLESLMDGWTNEPGYPIVLAEANDLSVTLTQKHYLTYANSDNFYIPITFTTSRNPNFEKTSTDTWLRNSMNIYVGQHNWFLLNIQQSGYYRVNYDAASWTRLIEALKKPDHSGIHVTNRAQVIDDLFNLARAGHVNYKIVFDATVYLRKETNYLPWKAFFKGLSFIEQRYQGHSDYHLLQKYVSLLASNVYNKLDFVDSPTEHHHTHLNRDLILTWMCKYDHVECVTKAVDYFKRWRQNNNRISPNARPAVYCTAIRHGSPEDWQFLWEKYLKENLATEKKVILSALGCSRNETVLNNYMQLMLSRDYPSKIRKQDINGAFASIYNSGIRGVDLMLELLLQDYKKLYQCYGNWDDVGQLVSQVASRISNANQISQLNKFAETKDDDLLNILSVVNVALETAKNNQEWYSKHSPTIDKLLERTIHFLQNESNSSGRITINFLSILSTTVFSILVYIFSH